MVAKITLEADDNTDKAFDDLIQRTHDADKAADSLGEQLDKVAKEADDLKEEVKAAAGSLDQLKEDADSLRTALGKLAPETQEFVDTAKKLGEAEQKLKVLKDVTAQLSSVNEQASQSVEELEATVRYAAGSLNALEQEAKELKAAIGALSPETQEFIDKSKRLQEVEENMSSVKGSIQGMKKPLESTSGASEKFLGVMFKMWAMKEVFTKVGHGIQYLAEQGNPAAQSLTQKFQELVASIVKLAESDQAQYMINGLVGAIDRLADSVSSSSQKTDEFDESYATMARGIQNGTAYVISAFTELFGGYKKGSSEMLQQMIKEREERTENFDEYVAQTHLQIELIKQTHDAIKLESQFKRQQAAIEDQQWAKTFHTTQEIKEEQEAELERNKKLAEQRQLSAEEQQDSARRLMLLEQRKAELEQMQDTRRQSRLNAEVEAKRKAQEQEKEIAEASAEYFDELAEQRKEADKQANEDHWQAIRERYEKEKEAARRANDEILQMHKERVQRILEMNKERSQGIPGADRLVVSRDKAVKQALKDKQEQAVQAYRKEKQASGKYIEPGTGDTAKMSKEERERFASEQKENSARLKEKRQKMLDAQKELREEEKQIRGYELKSLRGKTPREREAAGELAGERRAGLGDLQAKARKAEEAYKKDAESSMPVSARVQRQNREEASIRQNIARDVRRQQRGMKPKEGAKPALSEEDISGAQSKLTDQIISKAEAEGQLSKENAAALREAAMAAAKATQSAQQALAETQQIRQYMQGLNQQNDRRLAQRRR